VLLEETPEQSDYISIKERSDLYNNNADSSEESNALKGLLPFAGYPHQDMPRGLPFRLKDYFEFVDWTGLATLENKRSYIPDHQPPVLERLQVDPKHWLYMTQHFESRSTGLVEASHALKAV
jgi:hypothetical protein